VPGDGECIFCGTPGTMTGEDVLGQWLQRIDLDQSPVPHGMGWLNRMGRHIGTRPPYRQRIRDVCRACNSGWMSRLENTASRVLTRFILGVAGAVEGHDLGAVAAWVQKTCLTAMYVSTAEDRAEGYGLPAAEYSEMYAGRETQAPLPRSQFWMGRFSGEMTWSVRPSPLVVAVDGLPEPEFPHGYLMTIVLGQLLLQGVRMTAPGLEVTAGTRQGMPRIWPGIGRLRPWKPATELPASELAGGLVALPTLCGKHVAYYPSVLIGEAMTGRFYAFVVSCDCGIAYLIHTEADGAHSKAAGDPAGIAERYDHLPGHEGTFTNGSVAFKCKPLP
jgi:hypothetical protein